MIGGRNNDQKGYDQKGGYDWQKIDQKGIIHVSDI